MSKRPGRRSFEGRGRIPGDEVLSIIGVGLIGGSIGLAARRAGLFREVRGTTRTRQSREAALELGAIDSAFEDAAAAAEGADVVIVATGVSTIPRLALEAAATAREGALITDVGSVKGKIVAEVEAGLPEMRHFVGSHPLAGSHKRGVANARADLLSGATCITTPTENSPREAVDRLSNFWQSLGMKVFEMPPEQHDAILAGVSHLPHLVASALMQSIEDCALPFGASGLCDTTRVAAGDASIWRDIFEANDQEVLAALERFEGSIETVRGILLRRDFAGLEQFLRDAAQKRRRRFGPSPPGGPT